MDSDQIVFAEVKSIIGKTGKCYVLKNSQLLLLVDDFVSLIRLFWSTIIDYKEMDKSIGF